MNRDARRLHHVDPRAFRLALGGFDAVCAENSDSHVVVMQSSEERL
jgi:hypothetical protein